MLRTILLLTEDQSLANEIETCLQRDNRLVITAEGPEDFLNRLDLCQPDLVISDRQNINGQIRFPQLIDKHPHTGFLLLDTVQTCRPTSLTEETGSIAHLFLDGDLNKLESQVKRLLDQSSMRHARSSTEVKSILNAKFREKEGADSLDMANMFEKLEQAEELSHRPIDILHSLDKANFHFQTLADAENVASTIAHVCPDPTLAGLGLRELMINAIEHGNLGIGHDEKTSLVTAGIWEQEIEKRLQQDENAGKFVYVEFQRNKDEIQVTIRDEGNGFDWQTYIDQMHIPNMKPHGRGINVATMFAFDTVNFIGSGNEVHVTIKC